MKTNHLINAAIVICMAAFILSLYADPVSNEKAALEEKSTVQPNTLTTVIAGSLTFPTLTAADLDVTVSGKKEFTIFAPTDEAFGKLPEGTLAKILVPENKIETDGSKVFSINVPANNEITHGLGKVLVPKSLDGLAGLKN